MSMNEHQLKGAFNQAAGRVQSATGALTGDSTGDVQGKVREARARLEGAYGDAVDAVSQAGQSVGRTIQSNPTVAVIVAAAVGFVLGWAMRRD
jgi:uncharacterized protein YjbJ (UPF0337 family)